MQQLVLFPVRNTSLNHKHIDLAVMSVYLKDKATDKNVEGNDMSDFKKREKGEETKFAMDQETQFKVEARRNKLLGLWAADLMGLNDDAAQNYAMDVVKADLEEVGEEDVFRKIRADFDAKNIEQSDQQIRRTMEELMTTALQQINNQS